MKKCSIFKFVLALAAMAGAVACAVCLIRKFGDRIPFLSRYLDDEIEPEEDIFAELESDDEDITRDEAVLSDPQPEHEERRQAKIRRGYIPLRLHNTAE